MTKVYIAGKVTGEPRLECAAKFQKAQDLLKNLGFEPVNPLQVVGTWEISWEDAMKKCIKALMDCDAIYLLPCVENSEGAKIEIDLASSLNMTLLEIENQKS